MQAFISYSHKDASMVQNFHKHLKASMKPIGVNLWIDEEIRPGDLWDNKIKDALVKAQIFIFCVSIDFLMSKYINQVEIVEARKKHNAGDALIIPVLMRPCAYDSADFIKDLQALPKGAKPVTSWRPYDTAYDASARSIAALVKDRMGTLP
jgi:TIR domain